MVFQKCNSGQKTTIQRSLPLPLPIHQIGAECSPSNHRWRDLDRIELGQGDGCLTDRDRAIVRRKVLVDERGQP